MDYDTANYVFLDTETSSAEPHRGVVEIAWVRTDENFNILESVQSLIDPQQMISASASGIHGLTNKEVEDAPTLPEFFQTHTIPGNTVCLGHNVQFDTHTIGPHIKGEFVEACSLRWARRVYPDADDHKLLTLIFALNLPRSEGAHRAMADVMSSLYLTKHLCERMGVNLREYAIRSQTPFQVTRIGFGKYKGERLSDVPTPYLIWMREKMTLDMDLDYSVKRELLQRRKVA